MQTNDDAPMRQLDMRPDTEPTLRWRVGDIDVVRVVEGVSEFPRGFLRELTDERIDACGEWAAPYVSDDRRRLLLSTHSFVVTTPQSVIVVDTCVGSHTPRPMKSDATFGDRLADAIPGGLDAVDFVVCTHLHFDHVGWNTFNDGDRWQPTFPNARYLVSDQELAATIADDHMDVMFASVQPLRDAGLLHAVSSDHRIDDFAALTPTPGHSPGHVCVALANGVDRALITGDATHSPMQFTYPDVSATSADHDSDEACRSRERLLSDHVDADTIVFGSHFPTPTAGVLRSGPTGVWFSGHPAHDGSPSA